MTKFVVSTKTTLERKAENWRLDGKYSLWFSLASELLELVLDSIVGSVEELTNFMENLYDMVRNRINIEFHKLKWD